MSYFLAESHLTSEMDLLLPMLSREQECWSASYQGLTLKTALQPIFSIPHKRIVGYEALVRAFNSANLPVPPSQLFQMPLDAAENLLLDRLCRYLHVSNYASFHDDLNWLFLNVSPLVAGSRQQTNALFGQLLEKTGLPPHRVVIEIVEHPTADAERLRESVRYYQRLGCLTALDDFGAGHSNFERIWNLSPDIVKLDRTMLARAAEEAKARHILNGIVSLLHQSGCLVLLEGVETRDQALIAIDAGVDFVQGYYFHEPTTRLSELSGQSADFEQLLNDYKENNPAARDATRKVLHFFSPMFQHAIDNLRGGQLLCQSCHQLLEHPSVSRCYLINANGVQIDDTAVSTTSARQFDPRFRPLENTSSADWYRQRYLKQAIAQPGVLHITTPYLSITGAHMCVTLSLGFYFNGELRVLCCDVDATPSLGMAATI